MAIFNLSGFMVIARVNSLQCNSSDSTIGLKLVGPSDFMLVAVGRHLIKCPLEHSFRRKKDEYLNENLVSS